MTENVSDPVSYPDRPAGVEFDFRRFIEKMLRVIARLAKLFVSKAKSFGRYLDSKWIVGAEIDNRSRQILEDRYSQNWHSIRGIR